MIDSHREDFEQIVKDAGIPTTPEEMKALWNQYNALQGSLISNDSNWSPFWRLISAIVTTPAQWVVNFLITQLLPNSFVKTASGHCLDILAWGLYLERKQGTAATGILTFSRVNVTRAVAVAAGTRVQSAPINGTVYELRTLKDATFADNEPELTISARAVAIGTAFNLAPGYYNSLPEPVDSVVAVINGEQWLQQPGTNDEDDDSLRLRCRNQFTAVGQFHHDAAYKAIITDYAGIRADYIWFEHGAPRGPGSANVYLMLDSGPAPEDLVNDINRHINDQGYHGHGDDLQCFPMPTLSVDLGAVLIPEENLTVEQLEELKTGCEQMIRCAFRENQEYTVSQTWPFNRFSISRLGQELHDFFQNLDSVEFDRDDIESLMELPVLGSLTLQLSSERVWIGYDLALSGEDVSP